MKNMLLIADHLFVDRFSLARRTGLVGSILPYRQIKHGDIIVFIHPDPAENGIYVVKRVIGLPGDRIHLRDGVVYRNGEALNEPYVIHQPGSSDSYRDNFP